MKKIVCFISAGVLVGSVFGQAIRCVDASGKISYTDRPCADGSPSALVKTHNNTVSSEGDRNLISKQKQQENLAIADAIRRNPPAECRFTYFALGDPRGKALAENAKKECVENAIARLQGGNSSFDAQRLWQAQHDSKGTSRRAAVDSGNRQLEAIQLNQTLQQRQMPGRDKMTCKPGVLTGTLDCTSTP
jgi:hypothetical protein